jgi:uncharacterized protein (DUF1499 family)
MLYVLTGLIVVGFAGSLIAIRALGHDVDRWHVDPVTAARPSTPNSFRAGDGPAALFDRDVPVYPVDSATLASAWDRMIDGQPRVEIVQDDRVRVDDDQSIEGLVTYVQRSRLFGFPDYVSVRFVPVPALADGRPASTLAIFSRSRLGQSDLGVNEKRVTAWLDELERALD